MLQIIENAAHQPNGQLQNMIRYLLTAGHGQNGDEAEELAVLIGAARSATAQAGELVHPAVALWRFSRDIGRASYRS